MPKHDAVVAFKLDRSRKAGETEDGGLTPGVPIADKLEAFDIEEFMAAERIPSHVFLARAVPSPSGRYFALYSAPGLLPAVAEDRITGQPSEFDTPQEAEMAAYRAREGVLNKPRINSRKHRGKPERYRKLTGAEFAVLLATANLTPTFFAYLYGTTNVRVMEWIDGDDGVPHPARLLLEIFVADSKTVDLAEAVTKNVTTERRPSRTQRGDAD